VVPVREAQKPGQFGVGSQPLTKTRSQTAWLYPPPRPQIVGGQCVHPATVVYILPLLSDDNAAVGTMLTSVCMNYDTPGACIGAGWGGGWCSLNGSGGPMGPYSAGLK
jgi:hypothetical protein